VTGEDSVAIPNRRLQRVRELVTAGPALDIDQLARLNPARGDRPDTTALARPTRNDTTATVAPRRSSSAQTSAHATSSVRPLRNRAVCGWEASRPDGVRHTSPAIARHVGHNRHRHPRPICSHGAGSRFFLNDRCRQRAPGAARQSGHHSSSHTRRSLITNAAPIGAGNRSSFQASLAPKPRVPLLSRPWYVPTWLARDRRR
jgi:hypothetical protein